MEQPNKKPNSNAEKKPWTPPVCEDLDDIEIEGGAGLVPEADTGALS